MTAALIRWACLSVGYLAFAGTLSTAEGTAAVLTGAFAAALSLGLRARGQRRLTLRGAWSAASLRMAWLLVRDTGRVGSTLLRAILRGHRGRIVRSSEWAGWPLGSGAGRRAATALLDSLTPDGMALETDDENVPLHRLSASAPSRRVRRAR